MPQCPFRIQVAVESENFEIFIVSRQFSDVMRLFLSSGVVEVGRPRELMVFLYIHNFGTWVPALTF